MLAPDQFQRLWNVSDSALYPEAVELIRRLVLDEDRQPLPSSQVMGLLNIANASSYPELMRFIKHQLERDWQVSKRDIPVFYAELEKYFTSFKNNRVREYFSLAGNGKSTKEVNQEIDEVMAVVACEFIQHLMAENALLANQFAGGRRR